MDLTDEEIQRANERAAQMKARYPSVVSARYDYHLSRLVIELATGMGLSVDPQSIRGLEDVKPEDLDNAEISPSGLGIHFAKVDADIYLPALLEDFIGKCAQDQGDLAESHSADILG